MNILHLISSRGWYGAEAMVFNLLVAFRSLGIDTVLGVFSRGDDRHCELVRRARDQGLAVKEIECRGRLCVNTLESISGCAALHNADVLHTHGYKADTYGYFAAQRCKRPVVATCHNWTNDSLCLRVYGTVDRWLLRYFDAVAAVTPEVADTLRRSNVGGHKVEVIENGVPISAADKESPDKESTAVLGQTGPRRVVVGMAGRLVPTKGFQFVIQAAPEVIRSYPEVLFAIAGDGPYRQQLEALVAELGLGPYVRFLGERSDMNAVYGAFDIFVLPSLNEGMPMSVLEAMAAELPVIATRVGGLTGMLADGVGRLIDPCNVGALRSNLKDLVASGSLRRRMGTRARSIVAEKYSISRMALRYVRLYERVTGCVPSCGELAISGVGGRS